MRHRVLVNKNLVTLLKNFKGKSIQSKKFKMNHILFARTEASHSFWEAEPFAEICLLKLFAVVLDSKMQE